MEKNEDAPKKESKLQRFNHIIALKGAPYEALLLAIALSAPFNILLSSGVLFAMLNNPWILGLVLGLCAILFWELSLLCGTIMNAMEKWPTPWEWPNHILGTIAMILFSPLGIIVIAWLGLKKHRPVGVFTSIVGLILFLYAQFVSMGYLPFCPLALMLATCSCPLFVMAGIVSAGGLKLGQKIVRLSFAIIIVSVIARMATEYPIIRHLTEAPAKMEALLTDYRQKHGINVHPCDESLLEKEPLKNFISLIQALEKQFVWEQSISNTRSGIQKQYADISKKSEGVRDAIVALAAMPPRPVTHIQPFTDESMHPFPNALPEAARFLAVEMMANAQQPDLVKQDNAAMTSLRDWCLQQESGPFDKSSGSRIEKMRLGALARTLPQNRHTEAEWLELLGDEPDWRYVAACAYKIDADREASLNDVFSWIEVFNNMGPVQIFFSRWMVNSLYYGVNCIPFSFGSIFVKRLFMDSAAYKQKFSAEFVSLSLDEKSTMDEAKKLDARHETYNNPVLFSKPGKLYYSIAYTMEDARRMAMLSWKIMEYSREHQGALPENLAQVDESPVSTLNNLPFIYEHGDIEDLSDGGDGMITIRGFRLFIPVEEHAAKPNWKKARLSMIIPLE